MHKNLVSLAAPLLSSFLADPRYRYPAATEEDAPSEAPTASEPTAASTEPTPVEPQSAPVVEADATDDAASAPAPSGKSGKKGKKGGKGA
jgi:hypothetical protein